MTVLLLCAGPALRAEDKAALRLAVFHADLSRAGPGLLLRDITAKTPPADITRAAALIAEAAPDVLVLQGFDFDLGQVALSAFNALIGGGKAAYPHVYATRPNTGWQTGLDLDGDGRIGGARDAQGYGRFAGEGGMAVLSKVPLGAVVDLSALLWADLPGADLPKRPDGTEFLSPEVLAVQRLSTTAHWDVPVLYRGRQLHLLAFHATPPGFDGPEDRNGLRAKDELRLWQAYLGGRLAQPPPLGAVVLIGTSNIDPERGDGDRSFMAEFLADPAWQNPEPLRGQPTAFWPAPLGALRVSYILPGAGLRIADTGVFPAATGPPAARTASRLGGGPKDSSRADRPLARHLVWLDLALD